MIEKIKAGWRPLGGWVIVGLIPVLFGLIPVIQVLKDGQVQDMIYHTFFAIAGLFGGSLVASRSYEKKHGLTK